MKRIIFLLLVSLFTLNITAQKGTSQFAVFSGYEQFPELMVTKGYNVGVELKHYMHNRIYAVANFHAGVNDGSKNTKYTSNEISYNFDLNNSVRDYMLGFGVGYDLLQINRNKLYIQGTVGIGSSDREKDGIVTSPGGVYDIVKTFEEKSVRYAISVSLGYDFLLTEWLAVGVNYTGWQVGYEYNNSYNGKVSFIF